MTNEIWVEVIRLVPTLLWIGLVIAVLGIFRKQLLVRINDLTAFKMGLTGVEATFITRELERAEKVAGVPPKNAATNSDRSIVARRAERNQEALRGAKLLWVDDNPSNNYYETSILKSLGVSIDTAQTTEQALDMLAVHRYDVVITDMARGGDRQAGVTLLNELRQQRNYPPVIVYAGSDRPAPEGAFGSTNRPDALLHLVMDVLERERS